MIGKNEQVVLTIREFIDLKKNEKKIINEVIRDDVFIMCRENGSALRWKDINPTVKNAMQKRQDRIKGLKKIV